MRNLGHPSPRRAIGALPTHSSPPQFSVRTGVLLPLADGHSSLVFEDLFGEVVHKGKGRGFVTVLIPMTIIRKLVSPSCSQVSREKRPAQVQEISSVFLAASSDWDIHLSRLFWGSLEYAAFLSRSIMNRRVLLGISLLAVATTYSTTASIFARRDRAPRMFILETYWGCLSAAVSGP